MQQTENIKSIIYKFCVITQNIENLCNMLYSMNIFDYHFNKYIVKIDMFKTNLYNINLIHILNSPKLLYKLSNVILPSFINTLKSIQHDDVLNTIEYNSLLDEVISLNYSLNYYSSNI